MEKLFGYINILCFEGNLICSKNSSLSKRFHENTVQYYLRLHKDGAITNVDAQCLYKFLVMYENARHQPYVSLFVFLSTFVALNSFYSFLLIITHYSDLITL